MVEDRSSDVVPGPTKSAGWDESDNEDEDKVEGATKGSRTTRTAKQILLIPGFGSDESMMKSGFLNLLI